MKKYFALTLVILLAACKQSDKDKIQQVDVEPTKLTDAYASFKLTTDTAQLRSSDKTVIRHLIKAAQIMDELFWYEAYGDKVSLLSSIQDTDARTYAQINYGPWDRLGGNAPFLDGVGPKPTGANFHT